MFKKSDTFSDKHRIEKEWKFDKNSRWRLCKIPSKKSKGFGVLLHELLEIRKVVCQSIRHEIRAKTNDVQKVDNDTIFVPK